MVGSCAGPAGRLDCTSFSYDANVAELGRNAASRLNAARPITRYGISPVGKPVSIPNYAIAPLPVKTSPIRADAKPSIAKRPTKRSLPLVNPSDPKLMF